MMVMIPITFSFDDPKKTTPSLAWFECSAVEGGGQGLDAAAWAAPLDFSS